MYIMVIIINDIVLYTWNLLRVDLKLLSPTTHTLIHKKVTPWKVGCVN